MEKRRFGILDTIYSPAIAVVMNLVIAYAVYFIARTAYLLENYSSFSENLSFSLLCKLYNGGLAFDTSAIIYTNMLWLVMVLFPIPQKETRIYHLICKCVFVVINVLTLIINLADSVYFPYTLRRTTTSVFREFDNENNLGGIFFHEFLFHWYFVLLTILVAYALWKFYVTPRVDVKFMATKRSKWWYAGLSFLYLAVAAPLCVGGCRGGLGTGVRPITINNANQYVTEPKQCAIVLNTPFSLLRTIGKNVFVVPDYYKSPKELNAVFSPIHQPMPDHPIRKKNVVIIIVESLEKEYFGALNHDLDGGKYKGYTPNMDKLIAQSLVFRHSYANGHKSIDGMPSVLCGIPMFVEPFVLTPASMNSYTSMAGMLDKEDYHTAFFHGANRGSMGFLAFANKVGFQQYFGRQDYDADKRFGGDADFDGNWGIWDEPFLQYFCTKMGELGEPFMTAIFTVSSHHPFEIPKKYAGKFPKGTQPIHQCIGYTDMALGKFFASARKQPWFKNTIFVLTADHTNQSQHEVYKSDIGTFEVPIIIYDPSKTIEPGMSESIAQQIDIMPTIFSYLGYNKPYLSFGCDLLTTPAKDTYALNYINGIYQYTKYGYVLQFDGHQTKAIYRISDRVMKYNLVGKVKQQALMEKELKAIIQQYMYRMVNDKLLP
jgi:phosphoglycerol transferase MdoB-like AlkP superfamily enzyme